ncbi:hypothetical protein [Fodinibius halophilus]|uniref:Uncharacterized protein n=1 Tax=Fodinibius halophilus TaxID=1736908 RepID=A0A6M1SUE5_9BACT|nr:hypothetical protein [Fodinibius halophilus]NGP87578.1 hypothetical protein [Fodinibius halophilus]
MQSPLLVISFSLNGCNDPQDANEENFTKAINKYLQSDPVTIPVTSLGLKGDFPQFIAYKSSGYQRHSNQISKLKEAGIIQTKETVTEKRIMFGRTKEMSGLKLELTPKGEKVFNLKSGGFLTRSYFKIADLEVGEVLNFTMPEESPVGPKSVTVKFKPKLKNVEPWAHEIQSLDRYENDRKVSLILTKKGWGHHSQL